MTRTIAILLVALLVPTATAAAAENAVEEPPAAAPAVDFAAIGEAVADGAAAAASGTLHAASAAGSAAAGAAQAAARAAVAAAQAVGAALAFVATGTLHLVASLAVAIGGAVGALASAAAHAAAVVLSFLAGLLGVGYEAARAHPREAAIVGGAASGAGGLAWLARRYGAALLAPLMPLYTRLAPSQMLDNEARAGVYRFVREHPGAHPSAIAEALGIGWGTTVYHLQRLESARLLTQRAGASHRKCYFVVGGEFGAQEREALAAMAGDKPRLIVEALRATPGMSQKELADQLGVSQALLSFHVKKLVTSGVLRSTREGRSNLLHVAEHVPLQQQQASGAALVV